MRRTIGIIVLVFGGYTLLWALAYGFHEYRFAQYGRYSAGALISPSRSEPGTPLTRSFSIDREYSCGTPFAPNRVDVYAVGPSGRSGVPYVTRECRSRLSARLRVALALTAAGLGLVTCGVATLAAPRRRGPTRDSEAAAGLRGTG